jgi:CubicO group peptidase (beta-lactamase class C family)
MERSRREHYGAAMVATGTLCPDTFTAVREEFERNFAERGDTAAAFAVYLDGDLVVDLHGGDWQPDSLVNVFSTTKGMTALCAHLLIDRGELEVDAPVARYWPEFAQNGKTAITLRHLLSHRAGLNAFAAPISREDLYAWHPACAALAAAKPWWTPGSRSSYHSLTFGFLVGEVIRRVSSKTVGQYFADEIAGPLGVHNFFIGVPEALHGRIVAVTGGSDHLPVPEGADESVRAMVANQPSIAAAVVNTAAWRRAELPAGNGHGDAQSLARVYQALALGGTLDGVRLVSSDAVERMREPQPEGVDGYIGAMAGGTTMSWRLGFMPNLGQYGPSPECFGHTGFGGSFAMCHPERRLSMAYVTSHLATGGLDVRGAMLAYAVYKGLGA